ncbi:MAG: RidA family protein [Pseudomonadota bacterium]
MTSVEERLSKKGFTLPEPAAPIASYVAARRAGNMLFISGQLPFKDGKLITGTLGNGVSVEEGQKAAAYCAMMLIAQLKKALDGDFSRLQAVVRLDGFVASTADFQDHPKVINGASDLMELAFADKGKHARAAVGSSSLPLGAAVEVAGTFLVD